ncbi:MAG: hypothetical protein AAGA56_08615, partial [Myxococcota bacterium]
MRPWLLSVLILGGCSPAAEEAVEPTTTIASVTSSASAPARSAQPNLDAPREAEGAPFRGEETYDLVITGGTVHDGTGGQPIRADVVIKDGVIAHVGNVDPQLKGRRLDATGRLVTPGFIDTHAHTDVTSANKNYLAMGVTTICVGQDGKSPRSDRLRSWKRAIRKKKLAVNVAPFVGHGTLRGLAKVGLEREPSPKQIERLVKQLERELDEGAWGLSTGL